MAARLEPEAVMIAEFELSRAPGKTSTVVDGEFRRLCPQCQLPLGELVYSWKGVHERGFVHEECAAQRMQCEMQAEEVARKRQETQLKSSRRADYAIGWAPSSIPSNAAAAPKLGCKVAPHAMCCLVAEGGQSVRVAPTSEPAGALNLEYLSIALQVRRSEGREPLFSLDPVFNGMGGDEEPDASMQIKRFEPEWLAGTSVGEVMFQADYHLKELSFGEYEQPVVGMKSCFEFCEKDKEDTQWSAREWFVVRHAEMHMSEDQVLIPSLRMGVEAREQIMGPGGLEDAPLTRPDHPLVRYAEAFTHNFDLIAERKSVVSQLREVAKASIMAKFLLESGTSLDESWFTFASTAQPVCCLEVPQLWNDRCFSKIRVKDGAIETNSLPNMHGLYGGVDFGIDRFRLSAPSRVATSVVAGRAVLGRPATSLMATSRPGLTMGPARQFARLSAPLSATMSMAASKAGLGVPRVAAGLSMGVPQGVDLNLDKFNLSAATQVGGQWAGNAQASGAQAVLGNAFWSKLGSASVSAFSTQERHLFLDVFNPNMSDRREDGEAFLPPSSSVKYLERLKHLVKSEHMVRDERREHFLSSKFTVDSAGPLFPSSWTSSIEIVREEAGGKMPKTGPLHARLDYTARAGVLREPLKSAVPVLDRCTEDGIRFRIYKLGSLEVRTTQEHGGEEVIGMVFSRRPQTPAVAAARQAADDDEEIVRATAYVERGQVGAASFNFYVVLQTDQGSAIVVEKPRASGALWAENPEDLEDRNSLAKAMRSEECPPPCTTVGEMKSFYAQHGLKGATCTEYAEAVYGKAVPGLWGSSL